VLPAWGPSPPRPRTCGEGARRRRARRHRSGKPYLGLCLGLQLLFEDSDEHGLSAGLGVFRGHVQRFPEQVNGRPLRVPHIGWNEVRWQGSHPMLRALPERDVYYFVHGWRALPERAADQVGSCDYGGPFAAAVAHGNVFAVQFPPGEEPGAASACSTLRGLVRA